MMRWQNRFRRNNPCPCCGGSTEYPQHSGRRCYGFMSDDGRFAHCTRDEHAGKLEINPNSGTYAHTMDGRCKCGLGHGEAIEGDGQPRVIKNHLVVNRNDKVVARYPYCNEDGDVMATKIRYEGVVNDKPTKRFTWQLPDGQWGLKGLQPMLYSTERMYRLGRSIFLVEGEKCVHRLLSEGYNATCSPHGAPPLTVSTDLGSKWTSEMTSQLAGMRVILLPDNDAAGERFFTLVARELLPFCSTVKIVHLPNLPEHGDVVDWLAMSDFLTDEENDLLKIVHDTPLWEA